MTDFTKEPVTHRHRNAMAWCVEGKPGDQWDEDANKVTCPKCLKLMEPKFVPTIPIPECRYNRVTLDRNDHDKALCCECLRKVFRLRADMVWRAENPKNQPPPGFVWNPEYFTASHEVELKVHPDVWKEPDQSCHGGQGTGTATANDTFLPGASVDLKEWADAMIIESGCDRLPWMPSFPLGLAKHHPPTGTFTAQRTPGMATGSP